MREEESTQLRAQLQVSFRCLENFFQQLNTSLRVSERDREKVRNQIKLRALFYPSPLCDCHSKYASSSRWELKGESFLLRKQHLDNKEVESNKRRRRRRKRRKERSGNRYQINLRVKLEISLPVISSRRDTKKEKQDTTREVDKRGRETKQYKKEVDQQDETRQDETRLANSALYLPSYIHKGPKYKVYLCLPLASFTFSHFCAQIDIEWSISSWR